MRVAAPVGTETGVNAQVPDSLTCLLRDIRRYGLLSAAEEVALSKRAQAATPLRGTS